jgi:hypothetical protein
MIAASRTAPTKRVYFYGLTGNRPVALIDVSLVGAPFPSELQGNPPPVVEWQGYIHYWDEELGGYRRWVIVNSLPRIVDNMLEATFGMSIGKAGTQ